MSRGRAFWCPARTALAYTGGMTDTRTGPIEVWLLKINIEVTCRIVRQDETTDELGISSLSMRGAQREATGLLSAMGYRPVGRWARESDAECVRTFRPGGG